LTRGRVVRGGGAGSGPLGGAGGAGVAGGAGGEAAGANGEPAGANGEPAGAGGEAAGRPGLLCGQMSPQIHPGLQLFRNQVISRRAGWRVCRTGTGGCGPDREEFAARAAGTLPDHEIPSGMPGSWGRVSVPGRVCRGFPRSTLRQAESLPDHEKPAAGARSGAARRCCVAVPGTGPGARSLPGTGPIG
jgi:hypothetical protein